MKERVLALITARGSSKGLPGKNIKPIAGLPMIGWSIRAAQLADRVDRIVVSTDCEEIAKVSKILGAEVPFMRPKELAGDQVAGVDPVLHAVEWLRDYEGYQADWLLLLQPTSPLRTSEDINGAVNLACSKSWDSVIGVTEASPHPYWTKIINQDGLLEEFVSRVTSHPDRQSLPKVYAVNGAIYLVRTSQLLETRKMLPVSPLPWIMSKERSVDVDDWIDFTLAECLLEKRNEI